MHLAPEEVSRRWFAQEPIPEVAFLLNDAVQVLSGPVPGRAAVIALRELAHDPLYDIELTDGRTVQVRQSDLLPIPTDSESTLLARLQRWYAAQCDGDWEHGAGPSITTLDNPGWQVTIPLQGTRLLGHPFTTLERDNGPRDWINCRIRDDHFEGFGGPHQLGAILAIFLAWAEERQEAV